MIAFYVILIAVTGCYGKWSQLLREILNFLFFFCHETDETEKKLVPIRVFFVFY